MADKYCIHTHTHRERERERSHYIAESRIYQTVLLVLSKCNSVECTYTERSLLKQKNNRKFLGNKSVTERVQRERRREGSKKSPSKRGGARPVLGSPSCRTEPLVFPAARWAELRRRR